MPPSVRAGIEYLALDEKLIDGRCSSGIARSCIFRFGWSLAKVKDALCNLIGYSEEELMHCAFRRYHTISRIDCIAQINLNGWWLEKPMSNPWNISILESVPAVKASHAMMMNVTINKVF